MILIRLRLNRPLQRRRWAVLIAALVIVTLLALLQLTSLALLPLDRTDELAGMVAGMAVMTAAVWVLHRRAQHREDAK